MPESVAPRVPSESEPDPMAGLERLLALARGRDPQAARLQLETIALLAMVQITLEMGHWSLQNGTRALVMRGVVALMLGCIVLRITPAAAWRRLGPAIAVWGAKAAAVALPAAAAGALVMNALLFPAGANHSGLLVLVLVILACFDPAAEEEALWARAALRWLAAIVLFSTGLQKVMYGTYFHGDYLAWELAHDPRFLSFLQLVVSGEEVERLHQLAAGATGMGTFRTTDPMLLLASNSAYLGELTLPFALLWERTRRLAIPAAIGLFVAIEAGAREVFFGVLFVNLVLLFSERDWNRRLLPASIVLYLCAFASRMGWMPGWNLN